MIEFKVSDFLTLKLEKGNTNIYINGKHNYRCKYLKYIPIEDIEALEYEVLDDDVDIIGLTDDRQMGVYFGIDPQTEFWAHCSNLQGWFENGYDSSFSKYIFLKDNLFQFLKNLAAVGDQAAKKEMKSIVKRRFKSDFFIWKTGIEIISEKNNLDIGIVKVLLDEYHIIELVERDFSSLLKVVYYLAKLDELSEDFLEFYFYRLRLLATCLLQTEHYVTFLKDIEILPRWLRTDFWYSLFHAVSIDALRERHFPFFIEAISKLPYVYYTYSSDRYDVFSNLRFEARTQNMVEKLFPHFLEVIEEIDEIFRALALSELLEDIAEVVLRKIEMTDSEANCPFCKEFHGDLREHLWHCEFVPDVFDKPSISVIEPEMLYQHFITLLDIIENLPPKDFSQGVSKYDIFVDIIITIKNTKIFDIHKSRIEHLFLTLLEELCKISRGSVFYHDFQFDAFTRLCRLAKSVGWLDKYLPNLLETTEILFDQNQNKAYVFLFDLVKRAHIIEDNNFNMKAQFLNLINSVNKLSINNKFQVFYNHLSFAKEMEWLEEYLPYFLEVIDKFPIRSKYFLFYKVINELKEFKISNKNLSQIEAYFLSLVDQIDKISKNDLYRAFYWLIRVLEITGLLRKHYRIFMDLFDRLGDYYLAKLGDYYKQDVLSSFINTIESTELKSDPFYVKWKETNRDF